MYGLYIISSCITTDFSGFRLFNEVNCKYIFEKWKGIFKVQFHLFKKGTVSKQTASDVPEF